MKFFPVFLLLAVFALSACSTTSDYKAAYEGAKTMDPLQVPPDLSQPESGGDNSDIVTSYLDYQHSLNAQDKDQLLHEYQGMHFVREGSLFWLDIKDSPSHVWGSLHAFFNRLGFKIISEQPSLGIMQTNWQENRANSSSNWFLRYVGKMFSTTIMDSYRAHLEYDDKNQTTRVFITLQGVKELGSGKWERRPSDPNLEQEMLMRFMAFRGVGEKQAKKVFAQTKPVFKATLKQTKDDYVLQYNDGFARVWRLVGIALDRMGILIEDRNRSAGVYYMQLPDSFKLDEKGGFFDSAKKPSEEKYLLTVVDKGNNTLISVKPRGKMGKDFVKVAKKILSELKNNLQ